MKSQVIQYRGATATIEELQNRQEQLQQRQATRLVQYRGASTEADLNEVKERKTQAVQYRGAKADFQL